MAIPPGSPPRSTMGPREVPGRPTRGGPHGVQIASTFTPMHSAAERGDSAAVRALLQTPGIGETLSLKAHSAARLSRISQEDYLEQVDKTPLQLAISQFFSQTTAENAAPYADTIEALLEAGTDVTAPCQGKTLLAFAASIVNTHSLDTPWNLDMMARLIQHISTLPPEAQKTALSFSEGPFRNILEQLAGTNISPFLAAVVSLRPQTAALLLPLMDKATRLAERPLAAKFFEQLYRNIEELLLYLPMPLNPANAVQDSQHIRSCLEALDMLVRYGVPDDQARVPALEKHISELPPGSFCNALKRALAPIKYHLLWQGKSPLQFARTRATHGPFAPETLAAGPKVFSRPSHMEFPEGTLLDKVQAKDAFTIATDAVFAKIAGAKRAREEPPSIPDLGSRRAQRLVASALRDPNS